MQLKQEAFDRAQAVASKVGSSKVLELILRLYLQTY